MSKRKATARWFSDPLVIIIVLLFAIIATQQALWYFQSETVHDHRERNEQLHTAICEQNEVLAKDRGLTLPECPPLVGKIP